MPASFVASISGDRRAVVTKPLVNVALQPDRVLELWAAAGKNPPRSLGLISASGATVVRRASLPQGTDHLAVSLEPPGGSPTGAPTGPVLYVGQL
jgi:anti-sigma-K factor RskA